MTNLDALNTCLAWLTAATPLPDQLDGLVLCGNSVPATATAAGELAQRYHLPSLIIAGGIDHATKYLRQNMAVSTDNQDSEAVLMATLVRQTGYQGQLYLDQTSTNSGSNATNALALAPASWQRVLLVQDPLLARRTEQTFIQHWSPATTFTRYQPHPLTLTNLDPLRFATPADNAWEAAYFTELLLGEIQRLTDNASGYGPRGTGFIPHVTVPAEVTQADQFLQSQDFSRQR